MFGIIDTVVDITADVIGTTVEFVTLGVADKDKVKRLTKQGYEISEIATNLGFTPEQVKDALK